MAEPAPGSPGHGPAVRQQDWAQGVPRPRRLAPYPCPRSAAPEAPPTAEGTRMSPPHPVPASRSPMAQQAVLLGTGGGLALEGIRGYPEDTKAPPGRHLGKTAVAHQRVPPQGRTPPLHLGFPLSRTGDEMGAGHRAVATQPSIAPVPGSTCPSLESRPGTRCPASNG